MNTHGPRPRWSTTPKGGAAPSVGATSDGRQPLWTRRSAGLILVGAASCGLGWLGLGRHRADPGAPSAATETFDEMFRGRRIRGSGPPIRAAAGAAAGGGGSWQVTIDGRPLHLMRRADGSYMSMVDHYTSCRTALDAARGAVAEMGEQSLRGHRSRPAADSEGRV